MLDGMTTRASNPRQGSARPFGSKCAFHDCEYVQDATADPAGSFKMIFRYVSNPLIGFET
jgi:hypothetical protein